MELLHLRTFVAVVEHGGFRRAAAALHFSQPAVTSHIQGLERSLGTRVFDRRPGGLTLTPAGSDLIESARRLLALSEEVAQAARRGPVTGSLRIGLMAGAAAELSRPLLVELRRCWPAVDIEDVTLGLRRWPAELDGFDALIQRDPINAVTMRATKLFAEELRMAVPWHWPARECPRLGLRQALDLPLVRPAIGLPAAWREYWTLADLREGREPDFRGCEVESLEEVLDSVARGFGAAVVTDSIIRSLAESRVQVVSFNRAPLTHVWLTTRAGDSRPVVDELHREVMIIVRRIGPLVLPELASPAGSVRGRLRTTDRDE